MKVIYALLCEHALKEGDQKPSLLGVFSLVLAPQLPATHLHWFFAFGIETSRAEPMGKAFPLRIECTGPDGKPILEMIGSATQHPVGKRRRLTISHHFTPLPPLPLKTYGVYDVRVYLGSDTKTTGHASFEVGKPVAKPMQKVGKGKKGA